jgi:GNAT superfamily N-acetyltransferase
MTIVVRDAGPEDFRAVTALLEELGRPKVLGTDQEPEQLRQYMAWLDAPDLYAFVSERDGEVTGFVDVEILPRLNFPGPQAWIPDLIVTEGARSEGAGAALLARAKEVALERGAFSLTLESAYWRTRAHAFYIREGMDDAAKHFVRVIGDFVWPPKAPVTEGTSP